MVVVFFLFHIIVWIIFQWTYTTFVTKWNRTVNNSLKFCKPCFKPICGFLAIILWNRLLIFLSLVITGLNIYWSWLLSLKQDPVFPTVSLSHQEDSISLLSLSLKGRADRIEATITEDWSNWSHKPQPCLTHWNYEPCHLGPSKTNRAWWRVLTKRGALEKGVNGKPLQHSCFENPMNSMKRQKDMTQRWITVIISCDIGKKASVIIFNFALEIF